MHDQVRIDTHWRYHGFRAVVVENSQLRLVVLPELGGKLWSLVYKPVDREIFWHNPRTAPRPAPYGAAYDDWFCGGWDELFPQRRGDNLCRRRLPRPRRVVGDAVRVGESPCASGKTKSRMHLLAQPASSPTHFVERWITVRCGCRRASPLRYRIRNDGPQPLDFLWKLHPALAIAPDARIDLPACTVRPDPAFNDRLDKQPFAWPHARSGAQGDGCGHAGRPAGQRRHLRLLLRHRPGRQAGAR
jgi:hypothetical protein